MKVIVISKRVWIGALVCLLLLGVCFAVYFATREREEEPTAPTMASIDAYELNAIPVMSRQVPVYVLFVRGMGEGVPGHGEGDRRPRTRDRESFDDASAYEPHLGGADPNGAKLARR